MDRSRPQKSRPLTRREFVGAALVPLVLNLSCGSESPTGSTGPGGKGSAGTGSSGSSGSAGASNAGNGASAGAVTGSTGGTSPSSSGGGGQGPASGSDGGSGTAAADGSAPGSSTAIASGAVLLGLYKGDGTAALKAAVQKLDFSWLKSGDTVLIKVAVNSQYKHPTTTSPLGVSAMVAELKARGAGKVIVADQAGVEHVRLSKMGRYGATSDMFVQNGMSAVTSAGAETYFFDDQPFDTGYFSSTLPTGHHWPRGMYIPSIIKQVDHIVYMPRLGMHTLAGNTQSQKMAIGWLRDDSRHDLHNDAQYYYEKYTEVNYTKEIRDRFRMAVTVSEQVLLHGGPDTGTPYAMNPVMVHASTSMPNHDAVGASILNTLNGIYTTVASGTQVYNAATAPSANAAFADGATVVTGAAGSWVDSGSQQTQYTAHPWEQGITKDRAIARGWSLSGGQPSKVSVVLDGEMLDPKIKSGMTTHGEGLYVFA